jgi:hypothetical protein
MKYLLILYITLLLNAQIQSQSQNQLDSCMTILNTKLTDVQSALDLYLVKLIEEGYQNNIGKFDTTKCKNKKYGRGWFLLDSTTLYYYEESRTASFVEWRISNKMLVRQVKPFIDELERLNERYIELNQIQEKQLAAFYEEEKQLAEVKNKENEKQRESQQEKRLSMLKSRFPHNYQAISMHQYWIGMSKDMLIASIGRPHDVNRTITKWGIHEQWVYEDKYFYFENDILTTIQE